MFPPKLGGAFEAPLPFPDFVNLGGSEETAGRIVVVGHGDGHSNAAHHLSAYLQQHHQDIFQKLRPAVDADLSSLTAPQLLALGRHSLSIQAGISKVE